MRVSFSVSSISDRGRLRLGVGDGKRTSRRRQPLDRSPLPDRHRIEYRLNGPLETRLAEPEQEFPALFRRERAHVHVFPDVDAVLRQQFSVEGENQDAVAGARPAPTGLDPKRRRFAYPTATPNRARRLRDPTSIAAWHRPRQRLYGTPRLATRTKGTLDRCATETRGSPRNYWKITRKGRSPSSSSSSSSRRRSGWADGLGTLRLPTTQRVAPSIGFGEVPRTGTVPRLDIDCPYGRRP